MGMTGWAVNSLAIVAVGGSSPFLPNLSFFFLQKRRGGISKGVIYSKEVAKLYECGGEWKERDIYFLGASSKKK